MRINFFYITLCLIIFACELCAQNLNIIPKPKETAILNEQFSTEGSYSVKISMKDSSDFYIPLNELKNTFKIFRNYELNSGKGKSNLIWIGIPDDDIDFRKICEENQILQNEKIGEQGYSLLIKNDLILIAGNKKAGVFYGIQSLKQLIRGTRDHFLPGVRIVDWPSLKYRGILDDISRGPLPTMDYMKQQVRRLAELKMNTLQYYTEHVVKTKKHPAFAPADGSITIGQLKELSDYAEKYNVMLIGNFQSFGHFEKILSVPEYSHLGESGTLLSPAFPESIELLRDIYSEMVPVFGSPFFNINADETFDLGKGASKPIVDSLGIGRVYTDQVKKMYDILHSLNVRMMMWTDILLKNPGSLDRIPKDVIMMTWGYDDNESFDDMIIPVKEAGFEFTISPGVLNSYSTMPHYSVTVGNIKNFVRDGVRHGAIGMVLTVWDDGGSAFFSRDWYGVAYGADHSWNPNQDSIMSFNERFNTALYGDYSGNFTKAVWKLVELAGIPVSDRLQEKLLWTKVIPDSSESLRIGVDGWDKVTDKIDSAEVLLSNTEPLLYSQDYDYFRFTINQYRYFSNLRFNLTDAAEAYTRAFEVQKIDRSSARQNIVSAMDAVSSSRSSLVNLFNDYRRLWLLENKTYAVNIVLDKYQKQINSLKDIEERLFSALKNYDSGLPLPVSSDLRLSVKKGEGKYFREWMMINPVLNAEGSEGNSTDYLKEMGGELNAVPKVTQEFEYKGNIHRWRRTTSEYFDEVNIAEEFPENVNTATYAFANIDSPDDRIVKAALGSTDGVDVILNGELVHSTRKSRELTIDEDIFELSLKKGRNNLMLKLFQGSGDWKFTFRLPEYEVSSSKNRYKITE